ncbi:MAG TPA: hypothetical protein VMN57_05015 [Anaerolineales bacterium]|nr:hypothetical protein [Anaerolineales bacterium]
MAELGRALGRILVAWTLVTTLSGALVYGIFLYLEPLLPGIDLPGVGIRLAVAGGAGGLVLGLVQRRISADLLELSGAWPAASALGWAFGLPAVVGFSVWIRPLVVDLPDGFRLGFILAGTGLAGAAAAGWQWVLLRTRLEGAPWWLLANGVGWLMAWILVLAIGLFLGSGEPLPVETNRFADGLVLGACAGFMIGFEQGIALVGLIAQAAWVDRKK